VGGANVQSVSLYNNAKSTHVLVVRAISTASSAVLMQTEVRRGVLGTKAMDGVPIVALAETLPGQVFTGAGESQLVADYLIANNGDQAWNHNFPFQILQPDTSLHLQPGPSGSGDIEVAFFWEAIGIDELDFIDW